MLFNSIEFAVFLPIIFILYWFVISKKLKLQNALLLISSYIFYGWWDWRFLSLIVFSSFVDYAVGIGLGRINNVKKRRLLLFVSIIVNLGFLGFFKYFNFFAESFAGAFTLFGKHIEPTRLNIILPVGISFYTFQTLSYSIDVFKKKLEPTSDIVAFFAFVSFFPQLVAGPIERATNLLPQFYKKRTFNTELASDGMRQMLWGLFKKIVIADNCAVYVNDFFQNNTAYEGSTLLLGGILFSFQIYCDFSGYSDIAIGTARLFGFNLKRNFAFPYFSRDIAEFWRRWHISLTTWFRDYVYFSLGGSKGGMWMKIRNTFIIFLVSGFWHGANWTFIFWGFLNALYFLPLMLLNKNRKHTNIVAEKTIMPSVKELLQMITTFLLFTFSLIIFRADNLEHALNYIAKIFSRSLFTLPHFLASKSALMTVLFIFIFIIVEWIGRREEYAIAKLGLRWKKPLRYTLYYCIIISIVMFGGNEQQFIYFQF